MELRQLRYFVKAAETRNFSHAAACLNIAQSSLSQQIRQLEEELGTQLFIRDSHSIQLTEAGEAILPFALRTVHDAEACADRIRDLRKMLTNIKGYLRNILIMTLRHLQRYFLKIIR